MISQLFTLPAIRAPAPHSTVAHNGGLYSFIPLALADHTGKAQIQQARGKLIHAAGCRGTRRTNGTAGAFRCGADIIDGRAFDIERQRLPAVQRFVHTGVGGIAGGIYGAGQQHGIPRVQRGKLLPCKRRC